MYFQLMLIAARMEHFKIKLLQISLIELTLRRKSKEMFCKSRKFYCRVGRLNEKLVVKLRFQGIRRHQKRRATKEFLNRMSRNFSLHFDVDSPRRRRWTLNALAVEWVKRASNAIINAWLSEYATHVWPSTIPLCFELLFKNSLRFHKRSEFESQIFNHHYCCRRLCTRNYGLFSCLVVIMWHTRLPIWLWNVCSNNCYLNSSRILRSRNGRGISEIFLNFQVRCDAEFMEIRTYADRNRALQFFINDRPSNATQPPYGLRND